MAETASSGSSSVIWPWVVALNYRLLPWVAPVTYLFVFNCLCVLVAILALYRSAAEDGLPKLETALVAGLPALTGNYVWLASTGMEHLLLIATTFSAAHFWSSTSSPRSGTRAVYAGILCGLAVVTRPEAVAFIPIFALAAWPFGKSVRELRVFLIPCAVACGLVLLNDEWTSHSLLPVTFSGRKWLYLHDSGASHIGLALHLVSEWFTRVVKYLGGIDFGEFGDRVLILIAAMLLLAGGVRLYRRGARRVLLLVVLAMTNFSIYCLMLPVTGHAMRYVAMSLVFVFPLLALGAMECTERLCDRIGTGESSRHRASIVAAALVAAIALGSLFNWMRITDSGIKHINGTHVRMARWLKHNLPQNTIVASFDIGGLTYFSGDSLVDLGGLVDTRSLSYLLSGRSAEFLRARGIHYVVLPFEDDEGDVSGDSCQSVVAALALCDTPQMTKRAIVGFSSQRRLWKRGYLATGHAAQRQILFEITWHRLPAGVWRHERTRAGKRPLHANHFDGGRLVFAPAGEEVETTSRTVALPRPSKAMLSITGGGFARMQRISITVITTPCASCLPYCSAWL